VEDELNDEIADHLARQTAAFETQGLDPAAARDAAMRAFGGVDQRKEDCRDQRRIGLVEDLWRDVRFALRMMRRSPGFTAVAILSLALGIGANTAVFTAVDAVMLRPLPVASPQDLRMLTWSAGKYPQTSVESLEGASDPFRPGVPMDVFSYATFEALRQRGGPFQSVLAISGNTDEANIALSDGPRAASLVGVSGEFFDALGVPAFLGRVLRPDDDRADAPAVAVASHRFWQQHLGGLPSALGRPLAVNGESVEIVGVAPPAFFGLQTGEQPDLWIPLHLYARHPGRGNVSRSNGPPAGAGEPLLRDRETWWVRIVGRRPPDRADAEAAAIASTIFRQSIDVRPNAPSEEIPTLQAHAIPRGFDRTRKQYGGSLLLLMGLVAIVLVVACANIAGLLLERASAREREVAVRLSLGVSRGRLIRQLLTESVTLAVAGGVAALAVASWLHPALIRLLGDRLPASNLAFHLDLRVFAFTATISVLVGLLFGVAPALRTTRVELVGQLKQRFGAARAARRGVTASNVLIAAQVGLCLLLLVAAGLFVRTLQELHATDLGFDRDGLVQFTVRPGLNGYSAEQLAAYYEQLRERISAMPGVRAVTLSTRGPIGQGRGQSSGRIPGITAPDALPSFHRHQVGPDYFKTLGLSLVAGRPIGAGDVRGAPKVIVVNQRLVREQFKNENPIGRHLELGTTDAPLDYEIVGVVQDAKYSRVQDEVPATIYLPYQQFVAMPQTMTFLVRGSSPDATGLVAQIQREASAIDAAVPVLDEHSELEMIDRTLAPERTFAALTSAFGLVALLLACIGVYGTLAYGVSRRTSEIGVRMALGASPAQARMLVLRHSAIVVSAGAFGGLLAAVAVMRLIASRFYGVSPMDPLTLLAVPLLLGVMTMLASLIPAHRAARIDPVVAMRCE
jgi:predicted permease